MTKKSATYSSLVRSAWLALTIFVVIFCGPVKKMIELQLNKADVTTSSQTTDNKLRTWYREKRDTAPVVHIISHQTPDTDAIFFLTATISLCLAFLFRKGTDLKPQYNPLAIAQGLPLYLHFRKLQI